MNALQNPFALLARLLMAALFLPAGISKIGGFAGTAGYIGSVGLPLPEVGAAIAILVEVIAPILLIIGLFTRPAALVLAVFTLVASVFFHAYWSVPADQQFMQSLLFWKNIGVVGGLLAIAAFGAGAFSVDAKHGN
jgi:putative oxidoreductase